MNALLSTAIVLAVLLSSFSVLAANSPPSFVKGADQTVLEDAGAQTAAGWASDLSVGPVSEAAQKLNFIVTTDNKALFLKQPVLSATGTLTFTPALNATGVATVTVRAKDSGGTTGGGLNLSDPQTFTVAVQAVNDPPTFVKGPNVTANEDAGAKSIANWAKAIKAGPANESGQTVTFTVSNNNEVLFSAQPALSSDGTLTFTSAADAFGKALVTVILQDDGGTADGGKDSSASQTFTITVAPVNDPPNFAKGADQTVLEDAGAQTVAGWATELSVGPESEAAQKLSFIVTNNNQALFAKPPGVSPIGALTYTPMANANGQATVTVRAKDSGGTAAGGRDLSDPQTFTITVQAVNDAPSFVKGPNVTVNEDSGAKSIANWAKAIKAGPTDENGQSITITVSSDHETLFSAPPALSTAGALTFTPAANANGKAVVTVSMQDDGGTADGGKDTSAAQTFTITVVPVNDPPSFVKGADQTVLEDVGAQTVAGWATALSVGPESEAAQKLSFIVTADNKALFAKPPAVSAVGSLIYTPAANANGQATVTVRAKDSGGTAGGGRDLSDPQTFTITVQAVNDAPSFVKGPNVTVNEDSGAKSIANWAKAIKAGPADEKGQSITITVSSDHETLFSAPPALSTAGALTFTPAANVNGKAVVTVSMQDDGGTADGGKDTSAAQSFTIAVAAVNDPPGFTKGADQTVLEDAGPQTVEGWATELNVGQESEAGQKISFVVTSDNKTLFAKQPAVNAAGRLTYTSAPNATGQATMTIRAKDSGGTTGGGRDLSDPQTFKITVQAVNDAPSLTKGPNVTANEDSGAKSIANWAKAIKAGPPNESGQALTITLTSDNEALFSAQPALSATGTLTFTPAANVNGKAVVTVSLQDDGGTADRGKDTSASQIFTITVPAVNDPPSFVKGADQTVLKNAGPQTVEGWATGLSVGPENEATQKLSFIVTSDNKALFAKQPVVSPAGTLTYTPAANATGRATVTVRAKDTGGRAAGGNDLSSAQTFTIAVNSESPPPPANTPPIISNIAHQTTSEDTATASIAFTVRDAETDAGSLVVTVSSSDQTLVSDNNILLSGSGESRSLVVVPSLNQSGTVTITVSVSDGLTTANDSFVLAVEPVNDPPTMSSVTVLDGATEDTPFTITYETLAAAANESDVDDDALSFRIENVSSGTLTKGGVMVATGSTLLAPGENLVWTPALNANGMLNAFVIAAYDGSTASAPLQVQVSLTEVNDAPILTGVGVLNGATEDLPFFITYDALAAAADESDAESTAFFRIEAVTTGTLAKDGAPITPGVTLLHPGEHVVWTSGLNDNGTLKAFTIRAHDGIAASANAVQVQVNVFPANDQPSLTSVSALTGGNEDSPLVITYDALAAAANDSDADGDALIFLVRAVTSGTLTKNGGTVTATSLSSGESLEWTPAPNANGILDAFRIEASDGFLTSGNTVPVQVSVAAVNDPPTLTSVSPLAGATEDTPFTITHGQLAAASNVSDVDGDVPSFRIETVGSGTLTKDGVAVMAGTTLLSGGESLVWTPMSNANGSVNAFTIKAHDGIVPSDVAVQVQVSVAAVNDAPVNTVPGAQTITEDGFYVTFSSATGNPISVADLDGAGTPVQVRVSVSHGLLTLAGSSGLSFSFSDPNGTGSGDGNLDASMTFRGTLASINNALNGLNYFPATGYSGAETLTVVCNDLNSSYFSLQGSGGSLTDTDTVSITVTGPPVVAWGDNSLGQTAVPSGISGIVAISCSWHNLALKSDGTVVAWGYDSDGQASVPTGLSGVIAIAAGGSHSLALKSDGTVAAWGANFFGQTTVPSGLSNVVAIAAGDGHSLALKSDGSVVGWGDTSYGQLPVPAGLSSVVAIGATRNNNLVLKSDGTVIAWGDDHGQTTVPSGLDGVVAIACGQWHDVALKDDGTVTVWGDNEYGQVSVPAGLNGVIAIAAGNFHNLALKSDGTVTGWGLNTSGQITAPSGLTGVKAIAAGGGHSLALRSHGVVIAGGLNDFGQSTVPDGLSGVVSVAGGYQHSLARKSDGTVVAWGSNGSGQTTISTGLSDVVALAAGNAHSLALTSDGTISGWGLNSFGQTTIPAGLSGVVGVAAGVFHSLALKSDGTVAAWGYNAYGQGSTPAGLSEVVAIAAGFYHNLALKSDGTVVAWGLNDSGPVTVPGNLSGVRGIAAGGEHSLALKSDGTVVAWGRQAEGQATVPTGLTGVIAIAAGGDYSLALKADGTVVVWGANSAGHMAALGSLSGVFAITAGFYHSLAVKVKTANSPPTLTSSSVLTGALEDTAYSLTYSDLAAAADEADLDGDSLSFRIEAVSNGTLTKGGAAVAPGSTLLSSGESLVWTPPVSTTGTLNAFTIRAYDGTTVSASAVQVQVSVGASAYTFITLASGISYAQKAAVDSAGNVYVSETGGINTIRKITPAGEVSTLAGAAGTSGSADGTGTAAQFRDPAGLAVDSDGNVYVADSSNHTIRKITPGRVVSTLAGQAGSSGSTDGTGSAARFSNPRGVAVDTAGDIYVADAGNHTIRKITPGGVVSTLAGSAGNSGSADGTGSVALFQSPDDVAVDNAGNVYVADRGNHTIRKITPDGEVSTLAGQAGSSGSADGTGSSARFNSPDGIGIDGAGNLFVAEYDNHTLRKITSSGVVSTIGGLAGSSGNVEGTGSAARFSYPGDIAIDDAGNLYVADTGNHRVRKGVPSSSWPSPNRPAEALVGAAVRTVKLNVHEYVRRAGSGEAAGVPILRALRREGAFLLVVPTFNAVTYVLEYKNSLSENDWKPLTAVAGDGNVKVLTDPSPARSQRFYRVRVGAR